MQLANDTRTGMNVAIKQMVIAKQAKKELLLGSCLVGPHRDDFSIMYAGKNLSKFGSRGEQRLAVLWLKLAESSYIEKETGERPILLLDDILSELDRKHRQIVLSIISEQQTILTSADPGIIEKEMKSWQKISL